jgi:hypothetical protein
VIVAFCAVIITVLGSQVEVYADFHLPGEKFDDISSKECVSNLSEPFRLELHT